MKLRIKGNSLRLRLTQTEVENLARGLIVQETIRFGTHALEQMMYRVVTNAEADRVAARYGPGEITVRVPLVMARHWHNSDQVALEGKQDVGGGESLLVLLEKDFTCLRAAPGEQTPDAYPNPNAG